MSSPIQLIVGLGNPGSQYQHTRHNVGAWLVEKLADAHHVVLRQENKFKGLCAKITVEKQDCYLLFPQTYMNNSGQAVIAMSQFYKIPAENILVAHDELDLPVGTIKLKINGGHAGHNGLRDIIAHLGGNHQFKRARIGIGHPGHADKVLNYVLGQANPIDSEKIETGLTRILNIMPTLINGDFSKSMQLLHTNTT